MLVRTSSPRPGLTLVEMLVALALTVFMMSILSEAFVTGLTTMRNIKALGDMEEQLRDVGAILRRDLQAHHFEGARRLSELTASGRAMPKNLVLAPSDPTFANYRLVPPELGYFQIVEEPARAFAAANLTRVFEGYDTDGRPSQRDNGDELSFTVRLQGKDRNSIFDGFVNNGTPLGAALDTNFLLTPQATGGTLNFDGLQPNGRYFSTWAEVCYFLRHDRNRVSAVNLGQAETPGTELTNLFTLYRRQLLLVPEALPADATTRDSNDFNFHGLATSVAAGPPGQRARFFFTNFDVSGFFDQGSNNVFVNSPADVQFPARRFANQAQNRNGPGSINEGRLFDIGIQGTATPRDGSDILMNNLISFDVKVWDPVALFTVVGGTTVFRGAFVDVRFPINEPPYNTPQNIDGLTWNWNPNSPWAEGPTANNPGFNTRFFNTGTKRDGSPGPFGPSLPWPRQGPGAAPLLSPFSIPALQITIRAYEPGSRQTRQVTFVVDL